VNIKHIILSNLLRIPSPSTNARHDASSRDDAQLMTTTCHVTIFQQLSEKVMTSHLYLMLLTIVF
jgi:hypothetical protein